MGAVAAHTKKQIAATISAVTAIIKNMSIAEKTKESMLSDIKHWEYRT